MHIESQTARIEVKTNKLGAWMDVDFRARRQFQDVAERARNHELPFGRDGSDVGLHGFETPFRHISKPSGK